MRFIFGLFLAGLALGMAGVGCATADNAGGAGARHMITEKSAGPVALGMPLLEARGALAPDYQMRDPENKRLEEAGGVILWIGHSVFPVVDASGQEVMNLLSATPGHSDELNEKVVMITVSSPQFATPEGVFPGLSIDAVAAIYGTPILADDDLAGFNREWAVFPKGPPGLRFTVAGPDGRRAGVYDDGETKTRAYRPGSSIQAVVIGARRSRHERVEPG